MAFVRRCLPLKVGAGLEIQQDDRQNHGNEASRRQHRTTITESAHREPQQKDTKGHFTAIRLCRPASPAFTLAVTIEKDEESIASLQAKHGGQTLWLEDSRLDSTRGLAMLREWQRGV